MNAPLRLHTRAGCPCCDRALIVMAESAGRLGFEYEVVPIVDEAAFSAAFGPTAPVVTLHGRVRFRGRVDPFLLERLVLGERLSVVDQTQGV